MALALVLAVVTLALQTTLSLRDSTSGIAGAQAAGKRQFGIDNIYYTTTAEFPYQASIEYLNNHVCGAVIVSPDSLLTAAHCVQGRMKLLMHVRAGTFNRKSKSNSGVQKRRVKKIITHDKYDVKVRIADYDIAVVKLKNQFNMSDYVNTIRLPSDYSMNDFQDEQGTILGYGATESAPFSDDLRKANVKILSIEQCTLKTGIKFGKQTICTVGAQNSAGICDGDSGGPLVIQHKSLNPTKDTLVGIASISREEEGVPCDYGYPSLFTNVAEHLKWIMCKI